MKDHQLRECEGRNQKLEVALEGIRAAICDPKVTLPLLKWNKETQEMLELCTGIFSLRLTVRLGRDRILRLVKAVTCTDPLLRWYGREWTDASPGF